MQTQDPTDPGDASTDPTLQAMLYPPFPKPGTQSFTPNPGTQTTPVPTGQAGPNTHYDPTTNSFVPNTPAPTTAPPPPSPGPDGPPPSTPGVPNPNATGNLSYPGSNSDIQNSLNTYLQSLIAQQQWQQQQAQQQYEDQQKFRQGILTNVNNIISQNSGIPTADDPTIAPQVAAFKGQGEQALRQAREAYAERASAEGLPTGTLDSAVQQDYENLGKNTGAFSAGLVGQSLQERQANLLGASQIGAGVLNADQAAQLATTQNSIGSALANNQSQNTNAINWATLFQKPGLLAQSLGPAYQGLNNQNNQFYDQFGYNMSQNDNGSNYTLLHALGLA